MTNRFLCTIFYFVKGIKPDDQMETSVGTRGSDSLLHSLSSGLWFPRFSLECPISFSPFLPFGTLGNTAGDGGVFFISFGVLHKIHWIDVDFYTNICRLLNRFQPPNHNRLQICITGACHQETHAIPIPDLIYLCSNRPHYLGTF